jgi:hypothetical protein
MRGNTFGAREVTAHVHIVDGPEETVEAPPVGTTVDARDVTAPTAAVTPERTRGNVTVLA